MMDKNIAKRLIIEYQRFVRDVTFSERDIEIDTEGNHVFVGMRRAGKSYLMYQCIHCLLSQGHKLEEILFFNFEDDRISGIESQDLDTIKLAYEEVFATKPIFFLDEIQIVNGWEKFARRLADTGYHVFVTGSNAKMLSSEVATTLGGRFYVTEVFPFSFGEVLKMKNIMLEPNWQLTPCTEIVRNFEPYFTMGGLPEVINKQDKFKREWLSSLFGKIYFGDLITRHSVRNEKAVHLLIRKLTESVKQPITNNRAASLLTSAGFKTKPDTVTDYLQYMQDTWLTFSIENYASKLQDKASVKKYYFTDNGFISLFRIDPLSSLLENLVAITLRRKHQTELTYFSTNIEVDFLLHDSRKAYQVAYSIKDPETREREIRALVCLNGFVPLCECHIITFDEEETIEAEGLKVQVSPIWKWILECDETNL